MLRATLLVGIALALYWYESRTPQGESSTAPKANLIPAQSGDLERLDGARWIDDDGNDGDSFLISHNGRRIHLRLYYVDAPEKYLSDRHESQRKRVAEQGEEMGGLTPSQTVDLGKRARAHVTNLLRGKSFTIFTKWEPVYNSERVFGFVHLPGSDKLLCEELVEQGLARIHTQGTTTPDGTTFYKYRDHLEEIEASAKRNDRGGWGMN